MRNLQFDPSWSPAVAAVHQENMMFVDPDVEPCVYSWYNARTKMIAGLVEALAPDARTALDIGCAQGGVSIPLAEKGLDVVGNDIREHYIFYAKLRDDTGRVKFVSDNFMNLPPAQQFDVVVFTEVIEHILDHDAFLKHILAFMKPGGIMIVTTPNHGYVRQSLPTYSEADMAANKHHEFSGDGNEHFYLFQKAELLDLLKKCGFEVIEHRFFLPFLQYGSFKLRNLWRFLPARWLERLSSLADNHEWLCAQQYAVVRRPLSPR